MPSTPYCPNCGELIPKLTGAIKVKKPIFLCQKCFDSRPIRQKSEERREAKIRLINPALLSLISSRKESLRRLAGAALQLSIERADREYLFVNPGDLIEEAMSAFDPSSRFNYSLSQSVRRVLVDQSLWIPVGTQKRGRAAKENQMKLGEKVIAIFPALEARV